MDWPKSRELLSRGGNTYARFALGLSVHDATAGFRLYRAATLRAIDLGSVASKGYCFQVDLTVRVLAVGGRITEVPIEFRERQLGASKMSRAVVLEAMWLVTVWGAARVLGRPGRWLAARLGTPVVQLRTGPTRSREAEVSLLGATAGAEGRPPGEPRTSSAAQARRRRRSWWSRCSSRSVPSRSSCGCRSWSAGAA